MPHALSKSERRHDSTNRRYVNRG